jgi:hypothetical protein
MYQIVSVFTFKALAFADFIHILTSFSCLETLLEIISSKSFQCCHHIALNVFKEFKMTNLSQGLFLSGTCKSHTGPYQVTTIKVPTLLLVFHQKNNLTERAVWVDTLSQFTIHLHGRRFGPFFFFFFFPFFLR